MRMPTIAAALAVAITLLGAHITPAAACDWGWGYRYSAPVYGYYGYAPGYYGGYAYGPGCCWRGYGYWAY
jgi:hypothetical protein